MSSYKDLTANAAHVEFRLGASPGSTDQFVGRMFEFIMSDRAIQQDQLEMLNTYYGVKYGIS